MKAVLGQSVLIENKPGANGTLGADNVAKSAPDGYTLFLTTVGAVAVTPHCSKTCPTIRCAISRRWPRWSATPRCSW